MKALTLDALMRSWIAGPLPESYRETVRDVLDDLQSDVPRRTVAACAQLAMLFGDSGAPELCVVVSYRGIAVAVALEDRDEERFTQRFMNHVLLAMRSLGLTGADRTVDDERAAAWIREFLSPLGGSLDAGTRFAARLAGIRADLLAVPDPLTVHAVASLDA